MEPLPLLTILPERAKQRRWTVLVRGILSLPLAVVVLFVGLAATVCVVLGWSGDVSLAGRRSVEAKHGYQIRYVNPKEGGLLWFDVMGIPKDAPNPEAALKWINYIEDPKTNAAITNEIAYPTANKAARPFVKPEISQDPDVYLPDSVLARMALAMPISADITRLQNRLWLRLKSGG